MLLMLWKVYETEKFSHTSFCYYIIRHRNFRVFFFSRNNSQSLGVNCVCRKPKFQKSQRSYIKKQQQQQQKQYCVFITRLSPKMAIVSVSQLSIHFVHGQFHPHPLPSSVINTRINQPQRRHMIVNSDNWNFLRPSSQSLYEWFNCVVL